MEQCRTIDWLLYLDAPICNSSGTKYYRNHPLQIRVWLHSYLVLVPSPYTIIPADRHHLFLQHPTVEEGDHEALSFLTDVNVAYEDDVRDYTITLTFAENPYFKETELKKVYKVAEDIKKQMPYDLDAPVDTKPVTIS